MYVFRCKVGAEVRAQEELEALGLDTLCPTRKKRFNRFERRYRERRDVEQPVFAGYVFGVCHSMPWTKLSGYFKDDQKSLAGVLKVSDVPAQISRAEIQHIASQGWDDWIRPGATACVGDSMKGLLEAVNGDRATMLVDMLGRSVRVECDVCELQKS